MKINDIPNGKLVTLSTAFDTRSKMLNFIYGLSFSAGIVGIVLSTGTGGSWQIGIFIIIAIAVL